MTNPKISIITCTYNSEKYLSECIKSVQAQSYKFFEQVFIDGISSDSTLEIIKKYYSNPIIFSEKDSGLYDALNRGFKKVNGDIVGILHSDDVFYDSDCLKRVAESFLNNPNVEYYCSKMVICDGSLKNQFAILGAPPHRSSFREQLYSSTYYAHPTYYFKRDVIEKVGCFDLRYRIASDIDWLIRLEKLNLSYYFDAKPLIRFRSEGISAKKYFTAIIEEYKVVKSHRGLSLRLIIVYIYHLSRRSIRFVLEGLGLSDVVVQLRRLILRINK
ncbi:MAG: glycosyltransferase family 2 protein [Candidatus Falkowbacteria bacterium]|nr:glycosyltransferase family 2 protein [Candidatus Falkowbacteria bacterium]